ncbi:transcriptional regulator, AraC family [Sphingomonas sp. OK281]|nr:AraC family transcriptional regulator [Sphingomonas sp. OK281]SFO19354.1 transcriptional regulator, AraC family [Sphingomonas sp. OK281]
MVSQSSRSPGDPLSDVLGVLGARVTRRTRIGAAGRWALSFPAIDRLKFVAMLRGSGWLMVSGAPPRLLGMGDVCVLGRAAYALASHPDEAPIDGQAFYADGCNVARLGGDDTIGIGGTVTFASASADFLLDMLPDCMLVSRSSPTSGAVGTVLALLNSESERGAIGSEIVSARLADVLLVEAIRAYAGGDMTAGGGWLGALSDPRIGRALHAFHADVAQRWTVAQLATVAGMSRAAFSADFTRRIGQPPLTYLRTWRLTLARAALARGRANIADIANSVGYVSQSAFGHAYRRTFGCSPMADVRSG